ncbi:hypothetical protein AURDEDRAFT_63326 [Auricularia subglabra TFB-10046 SS5]|nr:hypothetical protein AURDEDRAFT_63326 [Auricularia subglabra TFB-10046 SS5]
MSQSPSDEDQSRSSRSPRSTVASPVPLDRSPLLSDRELLDNESLGDGELDWSNEEFDFHDARAESPYAVSDEGSHSSHGSHDSRLRDVTPPIVHDDGEQPDDYDIDIWPCLEPLSPIPVVRTAQSFITHLQNATLADSGLSPEQLDRLLHPPAESPQFEDGPDGYDRDLMLSFRLVISHLVGSQASYESTRSAIRIAFPEADVLHYDTAKSRLEEVTGVYAIDDDLCVDSCIAFTGDYAQLRECPVCQKPRYHPGTRRPRNRMSTFPIGPQIQAMHRSSETAQLLDYWNQRTSHLIDELYEGVPVSMFDDVVCGSDILEAVLHDKVGADDTILMATIDGLQLYRNKKSGCWLWAVIIINLSPCRRYKKKYVLPAGIVPGPNKPEIMESVLFRTLQHISAVNRDGGLLIWNAYRASDAYREVCAEEGRLPRPAVYRSLLFTLFATADHEAMPIWAGYVKHSGMKGCRLWCGLPGRRLPGKHGGHYYPMLAKPDNYAVPGCDHPDQPYDSVQPPSRRRYVDELKRVCAATTDAEYRRLRKATGLSKPSILLGLWGSPERPLILGLPNMCPGDDMHLLMNIAIHMLSLWRGKASCVAPDNVAQWPWAGLRDEAQWQQHGSDIASSAPFLPTSLGQPPRNPATKMNTNYKAIEYVNYFWVLGPMHFQHVLPAEYFENYCLLVMGARISAQKRGAGDHLNIAGGFLAEFLKGFEALYVQRRPERMHFLTQIMHMLQHLVPEYFRIGPGPLHAQWTIERHIGNVTEELQQHSSPYRSLASISLRRVYLNALKAMSPDFDELSDRDYAVPRGALDIGNGYMLLRARDRYERGDLPAVQMEALFMFIHPNEPVPDALDYEVQRWGGLRLPTRQKARSVWSFLRLKNDRKRDNSNVKVCRLIGDD